MRVIFGLVLILGLGLAGFAVYIAQTYMQEQQTALERERAAAARIVPTVEIFAVTRAMVYGEKLTREDVHPIRYVEAHLPEGVFRTEDALFPESEEGPRVVLRPMEPLEPVLAAKVSAPGEGGGLTTRLSSGMRAFAIRVDVASGVSGFLRPGDRVDIYWTGRNPIEAGGGSAEFTTLIEAGVHLLAVDQTADGSISGATIARTVTVEATPQQVAALAQAQSTGSLSLALVGAEDATVAGAIQVDQLALLGVERREEVAAPEEEVCTIRTRRGSEVVDIPIPCTD